MWNFVVCPQEPLLKLGVPWEKEKFEEHAEKDSGETSNFNSFSACA
jgi:hypothetical protein